ncbi:class I SAM-dependent methyltransferase [Ottowia thiooxydans]|uniref:class I SAM-dependent methyltransferase n=1 Tax=Ottowia thiooxydans TaxID=219182 RepID=UPI0003FEA44D|nr:class I SAM-dependent methyltransferase [Ottowia thiooxydans]
MTPSTASRTALATSLMRAVHSRSDPAPLLSDTWGDRLVPEPVKAALRQLAIDRASPAKSSSTPDVGQTLDHALRANAAYADVILRSRYTEDALKQAVSRGMTQCVLIGAGFDSFILRRPAWAEGLTIIEVDHPTTQQLKRERMTACGVSVPSSVEFVEADLSLETLEAALARSSFRADSPAFFSWLGVTMYLTREANLNTLQSVSKCSFSGSELVFTYVDEAVFDSSHTPDEGFHKLKTEVSKAGEAFLSGFTPRSLNELLLKSGLLLLEDLDGNEAAARYDAEGKNAFCSASAAHIAHARTIGSLTGT